MRVGTVLRLVMLPAIAIMLQACLGTGAPMSAAQPLPLIALPADSPAAESNPDLTPEQARAEAVAAIRAKAQAYQMRLDSAPYPPVFAAQGPPMAITSQPKSQSQIEAELAGVRSELESASDPEEAAALEERMAELQELGRSHAQQSEKQIQANSEKME